ncbi:MAG: O-methyltransferase [Parasporobacterium sp.]|nr:O-methyltransferase [Parasporobacterium sp.]
MIIDPNITTYIYSIEPDGDPGLEALRIYAEEKNVPVIRREMEPFMRVLLQTVRPGRILEIGTGIGYSALFMDSCLEHPEIVTIENYEPRLQEAEKILEGHTNIKLVKEDAANALKELEGPFDFIFLDAAKAQYMAMLSDIRRLLPKGGILLADNVLQDGELIRSRYLTPRRQRTIHERMREFIWEMKHSPDFETSLVTLGDGIILSIKKGI